MTCSEFLKSLFTDKQTLYVQNDRKMNDRHLQGGKVEKIAPGDGVKGTIIRQFDGSYVFRVYHDQNNFTDYELRHDELSVIIDRNAMASFYKVEDRYILDHSPQVLGIAANEDSGNQ